MGENLVLKTMIDKKRMHLENLILRFDYQLVRQEIIKASSELDRLIVAYYNTEEELIEQCC